jgi:hypothetical protein
MVIYADDDALTKREHNIQISLSLRFSPFIQVRS